MVTSGTGDVGAGVCAGALADVGDDDGWAAGGWAADGWAAGRCVAGGVLRLVVGRRLVCAIDADEKNRSSIAVNRIVGRRVVEDFIRMP